MQNSQPKKENLFTIPNFLSAYRLLAFPWILYLALTQQENLFAIFLIINLITDVLDGFIARNFNMQTEFGSRLDSIADVGTYVLAFLGVFMFKFTEFQPYIWALYLFIGVFLTLHLLSLIKFKRFSSFHLYSMKIGGYIQGAFFLVLFAKGFYPAFFYFMIAWGILAFCEHISIQLLSKSLKSNVKGLYWVLKNKKEN